jgi:hypothetical protein
MYCLFCDVPCIICVYMFTEQLSLGGHPIAVKYISYHFISFQCYGLETWRKETTRPSPENLERWNIYSHEWRRSKNGRMEQSKAMEYESQKASSDVLKPRNMACFMSAAAKYKNCRPLLWIAMDVLPHRDAPKRGWSKITISEQQVQTVHSSETVCTRTTSNVHSSNKTALTL